VSDTNKIGPVSKETDPEVRVVDRRWWARAEDSDAAAGDETAARKPTYVEDLERQLADRTAQLQQYAADHKRALDEFEQVKVRLRRDIGREVDRGKRAVLAELLEVLDNLDRALTVAAATDADSALRKGVELVRDQFRAKLQAFGVTRINALGQPFDAALHDAVSIAPVDDASRDGTVVSVAKEGYTIGDELLRPASVVVGRRHG
jgi:molecular chaperone GrpE